MSLVLTVLPFLLKTLHGLTGTLISNRSEFEVHVLWLHLITFNIGPNAAILSIECRARLRSV
jgi:hypothetical protein